ncbi:MAG TPA: dolichyl-phosphate beta-glucosyltransferase [Pyrinomonadaceae bacterium]|jgi:glycosyltransferase involved in cell wall biosynthesis|nr:dolichyl-phosphate beta-glucosyltransferase [Pyrinomonadaceae bacterium]
MSLELSVIIPAYNESHRLSKSLQKIFAYLNEQSSGSEVIVVDDGSSDGTADVAEQSFTKSGRTATQLIRLERNRGKGYAVRTGLRAASAPIALFSDTDLSAPITETPKLVVPIKQGEQDVTFGSRALDRRLIGIHQPWRREQGGRVFNLIVRLATKSPFWDTQCGFKAFRMSVCRPIIEAATIDRFGFDVELLYVARLAGLRVKEIPVRWDHDDGSKLDVLRDSIRMLDEVRIIRQQARRGFYEKAIIASHEIAVGEREQRLNAFGIASAMESDVSSELATRRI